MEIKKYFDKEFWVYLVIGFILLIILIGIITSFSLGPLLFYMFVMIFAFLIPFVVSYPLLSSLIQTSKLLAFFVVFLPLILTGLFAFIILLIMSMFVRLDEQVVILLVGSMVVGGPTSAYLLLIYIIKLIRSK